MGGSRGVGLGTAQRSAKEGFKLALVARSVASLEKAADLWRKAGATCSALCSGHCHSSLLQEAVLDTVKSEGLIDVLVCAAASKSCSH